MKQRKTKNIVYKLLGAFFLIGNILFASVKPGAADSGTGSMFFSMEPSIRILSSGAVDRLQNDVAEFDKTLNIYITEGQKLDGDIQIVLKGLDLIDKMANDLQKLDNALSTVEKLITIAKDIPQTEKAAATLSNGMQTIHPPVTQASTTVNNFNNKITPARQNLQNFDTKLQKLITTAQNFEKRLNVYTADISKAQQCLNSLPEGSVKDGLISRLDKLADASDKRVVQATKILKDIIAVVNDVKQVIDQEIRTALEPMYDLETQIEDLFKKLNALINPLHDLHALFSKSFGVSFPYPSPTWKNPFRIKHYSIDIGFGTIIKGAGAIEKEIEHLLSNELYKAAKLFGLEKLIKDLENQAQKELNNVLKDLHLDFKAEIPDLNKLEQWMNNLDKGFGDLLPKLNLDTKPLEDLFNDIENDIREMENIYQNCK